MNRGLEYIEAVMQTWPEGFKYSFGRPITKEELITYLDGLKKIRLQEKLKEQFGTLKAPEIDLLIEVLNSREIPNVEGTMKTPPRVPKLIAYDEVPTKKSKKKKGE